jgi:lipid-A-disaccharide synthase
MPRIVIIAGEASGDQLARGLIEALRERFPDAVFEGVTGPEMRAAGCETWADYGPLAVMGIFEVLRHLPRLYQFKRDLQRRLLSNPPDVLIGIDAPDFNLRLEKFARRAGIPTVHYVCPSVWAWRQSRVKVLQEACDLVLCLLPFERDFIAKHGVNACFVGHPLADEIRVSDSDAAHRAHARDQLGLAAGPVVALLPGSRSGELHYIGPAFIEAARWIAERLPAVRFVSPAASPRTREMFETQCRVAGVQGTIRIVEGQARQVLTAADAVLLASGTATLETMLFMRPMVVAYRVAPLTAWLLRVSGIVKIRLFSLPNLLADKMLVPEFMQEQVVGSALGEAVLALLQQEDVRNAQLQEFAQLGAKLRQSASRRAANAVAELLSDRSRSGLQDTSGGAAH